jgi:hypothetical protein
MEIGSLFGSTWVNHYHLLGWRDSLKHAFAYRIHSLFLLYTIPRDRRFLTSKHFVFPFSSHLVAHLSYTHSHPAPSQPDLSIWLEPRLLLLFSLPLILLLPPPLLLVPLLLLFLDLSLVINLHALVSRKFPRAHMPVFATGVCCACLCRHQHLSRVE